MLTKIYCRFTLIDYTTYSFLSLKCVYIFLADPVYIWPKFLRSRTGNSDLTAILRLIQRNIRFSVFVRCCYRGRVIPRGTCELRQKLWSTSQREPCLIFHKKLVMAFCFQHGEHSCVAWLNTNCVKYKMVICFCEVCLFCLRMYVYLYVCTCTRARHVISVPITDVTSSKTEFTKECFHLRKIYKERNTKYEWKGCFKHILPSTGLLIWMHERNAIKLHCKSSCCWKFRCSKHVEDTIIKLKH